MEELVRARGIADYQFGGGTGEALFPDGVEFEYSRNTGKLRHIHLGDTLLATLRPNDGVFTLTIAGARRLSAVSNLGYRVTVSNDVAEFVSQGRNVFAKHVVAAGERIRPGDEVVVSTIDGNIVGVGRALLTRDEMLRFKTGVAVKTRRGSETDA